MPDTTAWIAALRPEGEVNVGPTERMLTAGLGGALLLAGLARGRGPGAATGAAMGLAGALLLARAATGFCPAYRMLGRQGRMPVLALPPPTERTPKVRRSDDVAEVLGGPHPAARPPAGRPAAHDEVTRDSELSFPASDPPGWRADEGV